MSTTEHAADQAQSQRAISQSEGVPPASEDIHLPGGSVLPLVVAIGITLLIIGTTIWWVWSATGFVITVVAVGIWIRDVRRDVDDLPEEHHHH
jgi:hypothetical protein